MVLRDGLSLYWLIERTLVDAVEIRDGHNETVSLLHRLNVTVEQRDCTRSPDKLVVDGYFLKASAFTGLMRLIINVGIQSTTAINRSVAAFRARIVDQSQTIGT